MKTTKTPKWLRAVGFGCGLLLIGFATGCQIDVSGQQLPSAFWMDDDVQFFAAGPEFKLSREAAELRAARAQQELDLLAP